MKKGLVLKSANEVVSNDELALINQYTRKELSADEVYVFSVVLCDNDIDRDFERFTVESLFELEKLFVGKTGIFDHDPKCKNQTARIISCKVEAVDSKKTSTGDDYFRLTARAYIPKTESNKSIIEAIDTGILKEVSVGCAVKETLCSICSNDINSVMCNHRKGEYYEKKLCYGELKNVYDAYEFSFVAVPAQKNAGVTKAFESKKKEKMKMVEMLLSLKQGKEMTLKSHESEKLFSYIKELETLKKDGLLYKEELKKRAGAYMSEAVSISKDVMDSILCKLSVCELKALCDSYSKKSVENEQVKPQLMSVHKDKNQNKENLNNQFTI